MWEILSNSNKKFQLNTSKWCIDIDIFDREEIIIVFRKWINLNIVLLKKRILIKIITLQLFIRAVFFSKSIEILSKLIISFFIKMLVFKLFIIWTSRRNMTRTLFLLSFFSIKIMKTITYSFIMYLSMFKSRIVIKMIMMRINTFNV